MRQTQLLMAHKMADAKRYAEWIVSNADKRGTPEFDTVEKAYRLARDGGDKPKQQFKDSEGPLDPGVPEWARNNPRLYGAAGAARSILAPIAEAGGLIGGAVGGFALGGPIGGVAGAGAGYGGAKGLERAADIALGNAKGATPLQEASIAARNVGTGAMYEMGGQLIMPVAGALVKGGATLANSASSLFRDRGTERAAGIAKEALGPELEAAKAALKASPSGVTAGQALADVNAPTAQALFAATLERDPRFGRSIKQAQEEARLASLERVRPNRAEAETARESVAGQTYKNAYSSDAQRMDALAANNAAANPFKYVTGYRAAPATSSRLNMLRNNPVIKSAMKEAQTLAATNGIKLTDPMESLQGLHYMKLAVDNQFKNRSAATTLQRYSDAALNNTKTQLLGAIEEVSPLYGIARKQYAEMSAPVNQSNVLGEMISVLKKPGGGERVTPFLNVLGRGEQSLLKRKTGAPRFEDGDLAKVLSQEQMATVNNVASQMNRDLSVAQQVSEGQVAFRELIWNSGSKMQIPNVLNPKVAMANRALREIENKIGKSATNKLTEASKSPEALLRLLNNLPMQERGEVVRALINYRQWMPKSVPGVDAAAGYQIVPPIMTELGLDQQK